MDLLSLALSLALPMDGARFTGDYTLDVTPTFGVATDILPESVRAMTLPGVVLYRDEPWLRGTEWHMPSNPDMTRHELTHVDQQTALGPAFWLAYAATAGRAFEPYDPLAQWMPSSTENHRHDFNDAWTPPPEMKGNFPLFRIAKEGDERRLQLLPGYPGVTIETEVR